MDVVEVVEVVESVVVVDSWLLVEFEASEAVVEPAELDEDEEEEEDAELELDELDEELDAALDDDWVEFDDPDVETLDKSVVEALETVVLLAPLVVFAALVLATVVCWAPVVVVVVAGFDVVVNVAFVTSKRILIFSFGTLFKPFFSLQLTPKTSPL